MNKEKLGVQLAFMRGSKTIDGLTKYAIKSIEEGRSSYPVSNLLKYCKSIDRRMVFTDMATDESYVVDEIEEVHEVLQWLMDRWKIDEALMYRKTGIHYTAQKNSTGSISITTMLSMLSALHVKLDFVKHN